MPLPVPANTVRTQIVWSLPGNELAVNTLHFRHEHHEANLLDWAGDMTQRYSDLVADALVSQKPTLSLYHSQLCSIQRVDAYHLGVDGLTIDKRTTMMTGARQWVGASTTEMLPAEVAIAVSLYGYDPATYDPQGARKRGRIYLPGVVRNSLTPDGRLGSPIPLCNSWGAVISYMANRVMDGIPTGVDRERAHPVVLSRKWTSTTDIKTVRVDDIYDVQKRRQNNLVPVVKTATVVPQA
jgi:hypothetical protein